MAQRVNVVLVDDMDEDTDAVETVGFALDGVDYEIDLSEQHAGELRSAFAVYVGHARRTGGRRKSGRRPAASTGGTSSTSGSGTDGGTSAADIRAWARENGWEVPERGRVSSQVREAFAAAN